MLAGDSGGNRFNHGESQQSQPPSRPGTSSGKAETELSLTRDLAHGRNLGLGQCHERREHAEKISPRPRPLTRPHGPGVATIGVWPGLGGQGSVQLRFLSTWSQLQTSHSCHALAQLRPAPARCSQPGSWSLPAQPGPATCSVLQQQVLDFIIMRSCSIRAQCRAGWLLM